MLPRLASLAPLARKPGRFARDEEGAVTIAALIWVVFFIFMMASAIEMGVTLTKQVLLDRATDLTARVIRLGMEGMPSEATLRERVCQKAGFLGGENCFDNVSVETFVVNRNNWSSSIDAHPLRCENFSDDFAPPPSATLEGGLSNQIMLMRVCLRVKPMMIDNPLAQALIRTAPIDDPDHFALISTTAFVTEPRATSIFPSASGS